MGAWRDELRALIERVPPDDSADLIGELARAQALLQQRLQNGHRDYADDLRCYTAPQVAEILTKDESWVRRHKDALGAVKADGALLFPAAALRRFLGLAR
jgi:hypothetical protein